MARKRKQEDEGPKKKAIYTLKLDEEQREKLRGILENGPYLDFEVAYADFAYKAENFNVVCYTSGKVVVQGKGTEDFVTDILEPEVTGDPRLGYDEIHHPEWFEPHAGLDESGKGDLFGPLVVACVIADGTAVRHWRENGIQDSKSIASDARIFALEKEIRKTDGVVVKTLHMGMEKYNTLYKKFGSNTNRLLAWMHSTVLKEAFAVKPVEWGMLDQFSKQPLVQRNLKDVPIDLRMMTKAESDPVVAAASIVARALYVRQMSDLSKEAGEPLLKGASAQVKQQAVRIVKKFGPDALPRFAKINFKTSNEAIALAEDS
ncbi:ribonuclease HIII [Puniceicoccus vermicola]|uniref:Ribonuclease n=1 Tax=Puniceicoccus vermicola TaxID=388746 RepID=A0A7X1B2P1_9BACT|nr:ribonuclease HIII [Puniceicoccus vermicola]MBC2604299.1 ribonuclease HIII [Puniceicoccus vermicola]